MAQRIPKESGSLSGREQFAEFKQMVNQAFWEGSAELRRDGLKNMLEYSMVMERGGYLSARRYERSKSRRGYASGHYTRTFLTGEGFIENLRIPRTHAGVFRPKALRRYSRRAHRIDELIRRMYLNRAARQLIAS